MDDESVDVNVVDNFNFEKICRLCLSDDGPMVSLRELVLPAVTSQKRSAVRRAHKVLYAVCIKVTVQDDLPNQICQKCDDLISDYYNFKETCTVANNKLHGLAKTRRELCITKLRSESQELSQITNINTPKESSSKTDTSKNLIDPKIKVPYSKMGFVPGNNHRSKFILESLLKPADNQSVSESTAPMNLSRPTDSNEMRVESVILGNLPYVDEKYEDVEDPLAIGLEDIKNFENTNIDQYNNKYKDSCKDVSGESTFSIKEENTVVTSLTQRSTVVANGAFVSNKPKTKSSKRNRETVGCGINLNCEMRREDVTLNNIFQRKDMSMNTNKLLDFDNRVVPYVVVPKLDDPVPTERPRECVDARPIPVKHRKTTSPKKDRTAKRARTRSPLCDSKIFLNSKFKLKPHCPPKEPTNSRLPRYTYSRRCSGRREEAFSSNSEEPTASELSIEEKTLSVPDPYAQVSFNFKESKASQPSIEEKPLSVVDAQVPSNSEEPTASELSIEEKTLSVPDPYAQVSFNFKESKASQPSIEEKPLSVVDAQVPPNFKEPPRSQLPVMVKALSVPILRADFRKNTNFFKKGAKDVSVWHPAEPSRACIECDKTFPTYSSLVDHIKTHDAVIKVVECDHCDKTFKSEVLLASHVFMRHKNKDDRHSLCHICGAVLDDKRTLDHHMNKHLGKRDYLCDTCGAGYYNRHDLAHHIRRKHLEAGRPKLKCDDCGAEVSTPESLRRHRSLHATGPTEKCPLCPKLFARKQQVDRHMRSHTGETPYVCDVCGRGFTVKWNHTQHVRLHTNARPYACEVCGRTFTHNVSKRSHVERHHGGRDSSGEKGKRIGTRVRNAAPDIPPPVD